MGLFVVLDKASVTALEVVWSINGIDSPGFIHQFMHSIDAQCIGVFNKYLSAFTLLLEYAHIS